ncbi:MAG TPA: ATP synthase F0 subunit B [Deltaproteobacteria bacterium]|nr:ATP synthase F0 subunit B [Deltaproteobacteria bacterium]HOI08526.1 ATP synthase F0 subunit B [Deltaproteobacteria bacterium]
MIEINFTFLIQVFNFFLLMYILNKLLYKPVLKILEERDKRVAGGMEEAKKLVEDGQEIFASYNQKLHSAKIDAIAVKNATRNQAVDQANAIIEDARKKAETIVADVQKEMAEEIARVKKELEPELGIMASTIAQQILGRKVA